MILYKYISKIAKEAEVTVSEYEPVHIRRYGRFTH